MLDAIEKLYQENKRLTNIINKSAERFATDYLDTFKQNKRLKQDNNELSRVNLRLLYRLGVDDEDVSLVYQLEKELDNLKSEWYTAIVKGTEYEQVFKSIKSISNAIVNGTHFTDSAQDLNKHLKILNQQILDIIDKSTEANELWE